MAGKMSVPNVHACCCTLSATSPSRLFSGRSPPQSASLTRSVFRFARFRCTPRICSTTSQGFPYGGRLSSDRGWSFLFLDDKESAQCISPSKHLGTLRHPSSRRSTRRVRIRSAAGEAAGRVVDGDSTSDCLYLKRTICNGEIVEHSGTVIILGDVEPGAHVLADGDVIVLGRLQGHIHAGRAAGAETSTIFATTMELGEIQICDTALSCPDNGQNHVPQMAGLSTDGSIRIFPAAEEAVAKQNRVGMSQKVRLSQHERNQRPAQVAMVTGIYISVAGLALLGFPKVFFGMLFDLQGVRLGWVRVGATLAVVFGVYYIGTAVGDMRGMNGAGAFYLSTVVGRTFLFLSFSWLVLTGAVPRPLLLVGTINLVGAVVMLKAFLRPPAQKSSG